MLLFVGLIQQHSEMLGGSSSSTSARIFNMQKYNLNHSFTSRSASAAGLGAAGQLGGGGSGQHGSTINSRKQVLPRRLARLVTRGVSLVLERMPLASPWTKMYCAQRLSFFSEHLNLPTSVIYHHFVPLLHSSSAPLIHALVVVTKAWWSPADKTSQRILERLFLLVQDTILDPFFRMAST